MKKKKSKSAHGNPDLPHPEEIRRSMKWGSGYYVGLFICGMMC